jgi:hypothetical protein
MCFGKPPEDNSAQIARQQEDERRARVSQGTAKVDEAFSRFDQPYYEGVGKAYQDYYAPQLDRQYQKARDQLTYSLADSGGLASTAARAWSRPRRPRSPALAHSPRRRSSLRSAICFSNSPATFAIPLRCKTWAIRASP